MTSRAFVFLGDAQLPWIYPLGCELAAFGEVRMIRLEIGWRFYASERPWPRYPAAGVVKRASWHYPPGYHGKLAPIFDRPISRRVSSVVAELAQRNTEVTLIISDARLEKYTRTVSAPVVYLNYDDNASYDEAGNAYYADREIRLMDRASAIVCSSRYQRDRLRWAFPSFSTRVMHLPHGIQPAFLNQELPEPSPHVLIAGALSERYDWELIEKVVTELAEVRFVFAGEVHYDAKGAKRPKWQSTMERVLARDNVRHLRGLSHSDTAPLFWDAAVSWLPYDAALPFVRASCPLKLGDGIASGNPIVSADVPECRLYPEWVRVYREACDAIAMIKQGIADSQGKAARERRAAQVAFAAEHTWSRRASQFAEILASR